MLPYVKVQATYVKRDGNRLYFRTEEKGTIILVLGSVQMMCCPAELTLNKPGQMVFLVWTDSSIYSGWTFGDVLD
jgi:hypothetical protein